jgi:DNA-binding transcriptional LysR family regulator
MPKDLSWDDLRLILAVARQGTLSGAARLLGVTHSTVFRRLDALEQQIGVRLFERFRDGYAPTAAGESAAAVAARFADDVTGLERRLSGQDLRPSGTVRITTSHTLALAIVMPHLAALRAAHPQIEIELVASNEMANLTRREADVAIRPTPDPPETLIGRRVADMAYAIYAAPDYLSGHPDKTLTEHRWIGYDDVLATTVAARWLSATVPAERFECRLDSVAIMREAARAGLGLALLPCYLGDGVAGLTRFGKKVLPQPRSAVWLLTHKDLRRTARIRAVMDFLGASLVSERARFAGVRAGKK